MTPIDSTPTRILLARHGEVDEVHRGTIYGALDVPLSGTGILQSEALAKALQDTHLDAIVSSGLQRAETAAALVRNGRPGAARRDEPRFRELDRGHWAGMRIDTLKSERPDDFRRWTESRGALQAPGGESLGALRRRTLPGFQAWADAHPGGTVLIVAHLWVVRSAVCEALQIPMDRSPGVGLPPGGLVELSWPRSEPGEPNGRPELVQLGVAAMGRVLG